MKVCGRSSARAAAWRPVAQVAVACAVMALVLVLLRAQLDFRTAGVAQRIAMLAALLGAGAIVFAGSWYLAGGRLARLRALDG